MSQQSTVQAPTPQATGTASLVNVIRSEWTKFWSVRSTFWTIAIMFVLVVGFAILISWGVESTISEASEQDRATFDAAGFSLAGINVGQLAFAVLGVLTISSEYSSGGIRTSLTAVPRRFRLLASKATVLAAVTFVVGIITSFVAFFVAQVFFSIAHIETSLSEPGVLRAVFGGGLYLMASALFGFALGVLLRHSAGAITLAVAMLFVVPPLTQLLPGSWGDTVTKFFTTNAGSQIMSTQVATDALSPWAGYAVFTAWWVIVLAVGAVLMQRRDA